MGLCMRGGAWCRVGGWPRTPGLASPAAASAGDAWAGPSPAYPGSSSFLHPSDCPTMTLGKFLNPPVPALLSLKQR